MRLMDWLEKHDLRLRICLESAFDPAEPGVVWACTIEGYIDATETRPAVFITGADGMDRFIEAAAPSPGDALIAAVTQLRSCFVTAILRERDETITVPADLTY